MADKNDFDSQRLQYQFRCSCQSPLAHAVCQRVSDAVSGRLAGHELDSHLAMGAAAGLLELASFNVPRPPLILRGARIFDGKSNSLDEGHDILVAGNCMDLIPTGQDVGDAQVIDCAEHVIMPGMIDAHWHSILAAVPLNEAMTADITYIYLLAAREAERTIMRGFTTVRDVGGPSFA
ncbi:amidohydrolase family protein, partial [Burkholderia sp. SIMBA_045]